MAPEQVLVREVQGGRTDGTCNKRRGFVEVVLVMRRQRRAVDEDQRRLAASSCPAGPLGIVGWSRRHVAHVDGVQGADVDPELHRRRAEEGGQEGLRFTPLPHLVEILLDPTLVRVLEAEAILAPSPDVLVDLRRVLPRLEAVGQGALMPEQF